MSDLNRWNQLISFEKIIPGPQPRQLRQSGRSCFQKDYDRLIYASAFRRLGDKTQIIPMPGNDFVRNRLTHSLEVSSVARSLGEIVWAKLEQANPRHPLVEKIASHDLGAAIAAASLAHDIGNPPFGHFGEAAISDFFRDRAELLSGLNPAEREDLQNFEGNASGFRILVRTPPAISGIVGGFHLTLTTLAAFCKYPKESPAIASEAVSQNKYNAFQSDMPSLEALARELGLQQLSAVPRSWARHPFAWLVEAADDICNVIIDFEDGHKLGLIPDEALHANFRKLATAPDGRSTVDEASFALCYHRAEQASYLRVKAIHQLIELISDVFLTQETRLLEGSYPSSLLADLPALQREALAEMAAMTDRDVYGYEPVIEVELAGHSVITGLLSVLVDEMYLHRGSKRSQRLKKLIPKQYFRTLERDWFESDYENYLNLACFVSDMTDSYALSLYRKLSGIELPSQPR
ncbi:MAG: dGTP triphosphohydrolase [Candidatus Sericytochromatia bacterium]